MEHWLVIQERTRELKFIRLNGNILFNVWEWDVKDMNRIQTAEMRLLRKHQISAISQALRGESHDTVETLVSRVSGALVRYPTLTIYIRCPKYLFGGGGLWGRRIGFTRHWVNAVCGHGLTTLPPRPVMNYPFTERIFYDMSVNFVGSSWIDKI